MSNFESSPEHCYDFHSVVKCFSPLNCCLMLDSDIKVLTFETVRMNSGQQKMSPQQHRSTQLPSCGRLEGSRTTQSSAAHHEILGCSVKDCLCLPKVMVSAWDGAPLTISCSPSFGGWDFWVLPCPVSALSPAPTATAGVCSKFILGQVKCQATTWELLIKELFKWKNF